MKALETGRSMNKELRLAKVMILGLVFATLVPIVNTQSFVVDLKEVQDVVKHSEKAFTFANLTFENARAFYAKGDIESGDAQLEEITTGSMNASALWPLVDKPQLYKRAEQKVASLQRRIQVVVDEIQLPGRILCPGSHVAHCFCQH
jgi:hypothetical protein